MEILKLSPGRIGWIALLCLLAFVAPRGRDPHTVGRTSSDAEALPPRDTPRPRSPASRSTRDALKQGQDLFSSGMLPRLSVELTRAEISKLEKYHWQWGGNAAEREDARATIYESGVVYTNVAIHLKGSAGSFRPVGDKPSLTLNFDKFAPGQKFHGLKKIHLNNSIQDQSHLSEQISREMFLAAGVPTTRATQAKVELNGRDLGVYVLVEGWNKQFLKQHFKRSDGVLYDGGFAKEISFPLEVMSGDEITDRSDLTALVSAAHRPANERIAKLAEILDVDRFLSFLAMEVLLAHADGYAMNRNNYRIYHDPESGKLVFMPHGMDQMFGSWNSTPRLSITPLMKGLVAKAVMQTAEGRRRYLDRLGQLYTNVYRTDLILKRVDELSARLQPLLSEGSLWNRPGHAYGLTDLRRRISERGTSIQEQLSRPSVPLEFSRAGEVKLAGWTRQAGRNVNYAEGRSEEGHRLLKIKLQGSGSGSWRTTVLLEPGQYHFVGRVKIEGLAVDPADSRSGVGLRLSGDPLQQRFLNDTDWTDIRYDFELSGNGEVQLICELKGLEGEAAFDTDSLRLRRN